MESERDNIKKMIVYKKVKEITDYLYSGLDPNYEGGWPIRLAARYGSCSIVQILIQFGANPHLLSDSGASTLQLAVLSGKNWDTDNWLFLLTCSNSSQLAEGAAVAIVFNNISAFRKILGTGRCNTSIPTTLTGKTLESLAKIYKLEHLLNTPIIKISNHNENIASHSPRTARPKRWDIQTITTTTTPLQTQINLSPSVAKFFNQTARHPSLTPPQSPGATASTPTVKYGPLCRD